LEKHHSPLPEYLWLVTPSLTLAGELVHPLPQRALWWPARRVLFVADVHLGKASTFRARGLPIGAGLCGAIAARDLDVLSGLIARLGVEHLIMLGDLLHAPEAKDPEVLGAFGAWRARHPARDLTITLVRGNHDRKAGDPPADWGIDCRPEGIALGNFALWHDPANASPAADGYALAGHLHPGVVIEAGGRREKAACFWFGSRVGVLPAFGRFTGCVAIRPEPGDHVLAVGPGAVLPVPGVLPARARVM
jgi:DNA ligase-associated metallophosphoesterase